MGNLECQYAGIDEDGILEAIEDCILVLEEGRCGHLKMVVNKFSPAAAEQ